jgi:cyclase
VNFKEIESRGLLCTFEEPYKTNVFLIKGEDHLFLCDTFLGNESMTKVKQYLRKHKLDTKPIIVFNSHADYDHYWGNGSFKSSLIIGHELSRKRILDESKDSLKTFQSHKQGLVEIVPPNLLFREQIMFPNEKLEFYYTPGHTADSASCFDHKDKMLFAGDNIESPIPYINELDFSQYVNTLKEYLKRSAKIVLSGHDEAMHDNNLIKNNLDYVLRFQNSTVDLAALDKHAKIVHFQNLKNIGEKLRSQGMARQALDYYSRGIDVLDRLDDSTQGKEQQLKEVTRIITALKSQLRH